MPLLPTCPPTLLSPPPVSGRRLWANLLEKAGSLSRLLPLRWLHGHENAAAPGRVVLEQPRLPLTTARVAVARAARANNESAAASIGVDLGTYNMLMDLQHRDITPEDYETLRRLDASVKPRTLSSVALEKSAPCWQIPLMEGEHAARAPIGFRNDDVCAICLECFDQGDSVRRLPCKHLFHTHCIDEWLFHCSHCCPEDGLPVLPDNELAL